MKRLATVLLALAASCSSPNELPSENRTTSIAGDTCAEYRDGETLVHIVCSADLQCLANIFLDEDGSGWAGICHPREATTCESQTQCVDGWLCTDGSSGRGPLRQECLKACSMHSDCPGRFQVCADGACRMRACPFAGETDANPDSSCPANTRCNEKGACVSP
jgi:hypothetical protein